MNFILFFLPLSLFMSHVSFMEWSFSSEDNTITLFTSKHFSVNIDGGAMMLLELYIDMGMNDCYIQEPRHLKIGYYQSQIFQ